MNTLPKRPSGRTADALRAVSFDLGVNKHAEGSCLVKFGDTHVLCLSPTAGITGAQTLVGVVRSFARSAVSLESLTLRRRGAAVQTIAPDLESAAAMGSDFMNGEPRGRVLGAGYRQGLTVGSAKPER